MLKKYHLPGTFYVTTSLLGTPGYLTTTQVIKLAQQGHEIASHGVTHRSLKKRPPVEIEKELLESKHMLETFIQAPVTSFAPPFGATDIHVLRLIKKYYRSGRTIAPGLNDLSNSCAMRAHVVLRTTPITTVEQWIDRAIAEKKWLILVYHHIDDTEDIISISAQDFECHLQLIRSKQIHVITMHQIDSQYPHQK